MLGWAPGVQPEALKVVAAGERPIGERLEANGHRVIAGDGLVLAPAFIDPHVHLRTPGREDEETIASGTAAAAAGPIPG